MQRKFRRSIPFAVILYLLGVSVFAFFLYRRDYRDKVNEIDQQLLSAAQAARLLVPGDFLERAVKDDAISPEEYLRIAAQLAALRETLPQVELVGTEFHDQTHSHSTSSSSPSVRYWSQDIETPFYSLEQKLRSEAARFVTTVRDGVKYREIHLRAHRVQDGVALFCAAARLSQLPGQLAHGIVTVLLISLGFSLLALPLLLAIARQRTFHLREVEALRLAALQASVREEKIHLEFLKFQLRPHFLFNALNSVCSLIRVDPVKAEEMTIRLSRYCRSTIFARNREIVPLIEKLDIARDYLAIEQIRWGDRLQLVVESSVPCPETLMVPPHILQPLLENAVKYGQRSGCKVLRIEVRIWLEKDSLVMEVANSGRWFDPLENAEDDAESTRFGLDNLLKRLEAHYGPGDYLSIVTCDERGMVRCRLILPLDRGTHE